MERQNRIRRIGEAEIYQYARDRKFEETAIALSLLCETPIDVVERALLDPGAEIVMILAKVAGLSSTTTKAILLLRAADRGMSANDLEQALASFDRLQPDTAQRVLGFFRTRVKKPAEPMVPPAVRQRLALRRPRQVHSPGEMRHQAQRRFPVDRSALGMAEAVGRHAFHGRARLAIGKSEPNRICDTGMSLNRAANWPGCGPGRSRRSICARSPRPVRHARVLLRSRWWMKRPIRNGSVPPLCDQMNLMSGQRKAVPAFAEDQAGDGARGVGGELDGAGRTPVIKLVQQAGEVGWV